ncbi:MAG: bifunctional phosphoribosylaminoimidazolecarboxamide formyltransferase/IMP cyclohydrolase [Bdellovibrio sp.]
MNVKIKRALLSVTNKTGIVDVAKALISHGVEIISSGGTAKHLQAENIPVTPIEKVTGNPEAFGGRMKTISFQIGSALLFRRDNAEDVNTANELGIGPIDLVICNLYPFAEVVKNGGTYDEMIENIDIGGPTMIRAAAKNHRHVTVLTSPDQYQDFLKSYLSLNGETEFGLRQRFALKAFELMALYDATVAQQLAKVAEQTLQTQIISPLQASTLRYGENPHQKGYVVSNSIETGLASIVPLQGKELSYNNLLDADAAWRSVVDLHNRCHQNFKFGVSIIKHSTPCGMALSDCQLNALENAWSGDPVSSFGGIIAFNQKVEADVAQFFQDKFIEVILAPDFEDSALKIFSTKKNVRVLKVPMVDALPGPMIRSIFGGFVMQEEDNGVAPKIEQVTKLKFSPSLESLIPFGLITCKHLKSNAISLVKMSSRGPILIGAGMGNPNRLVSVEQAVNKAIENGHTDLSDAVLVSDAFFPFPDTVECAHKFGIRNIIQPGGSIKDQEVIARADELTVAMVFTGMRHFRH